MPEKDKKIINGWIFYDWANSVYPLVITTAIFPIFYEAVTTSKGINGELSDVVTFFGNSVINTALYTYIIALSFLIVSVISPLLSGVADYIGNKKRFLQFFCYLGASACASLYFFDTSYLEFSMFLVMMTSIGFWGSLVFYNAYLPEIAPATEHDRISAKGYAFGYIGSSILLIGLLVAIQVFDMPAKWSFVITGLWWAGFAQITYARLPKVIKTDSHAKGKLLKGFLELKKVLSQLKDLSSLKKYLRAFFVYSMGVQTVMLMATLFGKKEIIDMPDSGLIISVLLIQFVAVGGAYLFSWVSKKIGNINALIIAVVMWVFICIAAYFIYTAIGFYVLAGVVGLVMGGIQSLSRSTYSKLIPEGSKDTASFFSFYDVTEKIGIVIGMFAYGAIEAITGSMRNSVIGLITFFVLGLILLLYVPRKKLLI
ncbi:MAG: UMF1 family MFS transporter [Flavobacteriales bacterium]|jgi:UMF1 family MFS transporter